MNRYLKNLEKIEFVVTYACTGRCKHCSEGDHASCGKRIDPTVAADAVRKIAAEYDIKTVMTFGGAILPKMLLAELNLFCVRDGGPLQKRLKSLRLDLPKQLEQNMPLQLIPAQLH